jgi:hypothetical protein
MQISIVLHLSGSLTGYQPFENAKDCLRAIVQVDSLPDCYQWTLDVIEAQIARCLLLSGCSAPSPGH